MSPNPGYGNDLLTRHPWHLARRYYLHHHHRVSYPMTCILFSLSTIGVIAAFLVFLSPGVSAELRSLPLFEFCLPIAYLFGLNYWRMDRSARYFASEATADGNYTVRDIAAFYESYYVT